MKDKAFLKIFSIVGILLFPFATNANLVLPTSYDMPNGNSGVFHYWDDTYNGSGNTLIDGSALSGGLGDLTDGIIATDNWFVTEDPISDPGPYVGWLNFDPTIVFQFASPISLALINIHFDDSEGAGGVVAPDSVTINGVNFGVIDPVGPEPFFASFDV